MTPVRTVEIARADGASCADEVVVEEPLEIRVAGDPIATTMRTPGDDRELVLGFLWAEGILREVSDVTAIAHCGRPGEEGHGNVVEVTLNGAVKFDPERRRGTLTTSACGVCGRRTIDDLLGAFAPLPARRALAEGFVARAIKGLRERQPVFARTGGCHAASIVRFDESPRCTFEDIGRHNAVDKAVGSRLLAGEVSLADHALVVSGRVSFEIVQKAIAARLPVVIGVSAASSLAVDLARRANVTLIGFARDHGFNVYSGKL